MKASSLTTRERDYRTLVEYVEKREKKDVCLFCSMMMNQFCPYMYARALSLIRPPQIEPVTKTERERERREEKNAREEEERYTSMYIVTPVAVK